MHVQEKLFRNQFLQRGGWQTGTRSEEARFNYFFFFFFDLTISMTKHEGEKNSFSRIIVLKVSSLSNLAPMASTPIIHSRRINIC